MKNKTLWIVVVILVAINGFVLYKHKKYQKDVAIVIGSQQNIIDEHQTLSYQLPLNFQCNNMLLDTICVEDTLGNVNQLRNFIDNDIIVCRISENYCGSCNEYAMNIFLKYAKEFDNKHFAFMMSCEAHRNFKYSIKQYKLNNFGAFLVDEHFLPADDIGFPYYFVIGKDLKIKGIYMPSKATPDLDVQNLKMLYNYCVK